MALITVTTLNDEQDANPEDNGLSLREAIDIANTSAGQDTIVFAPELNGVVRLTSGPLAIGDNLIILGGGVITISGDALGDDVLNNGVTDVDASQVGEDRLDDNMQIFNVATAAERVLLADLTLTGGRTETNIFRGGAIYSPEGVELIIRESVIAGNSTAGAGSRGGAVYSKGFLTVQDSTVSGNRTEGDFSDGGALFGDTVTLSRNTVTDNVTRGRYAEGGGAASNDDFGAFGNFFDFNQTFGFGSSGGGVFAGGVGTFTNNTLTGNLTNGTYADGGGIFANGDATLINNTLSGNAALAPGSFGGGLRTNYDLTAQGNVITGNSASSGADVSLFSTNGGGGVTNTFDGLNIIGSDLTGFDPGISDNVINADPTQVFDQTALVNGVTAGVAADNGGPVQTVALKADVTNPALDASGPGAPATDARGVDAFDQPEVENFFVDGDVNDGARDLGAFEQEEPLDNIEGDEPRSLVVTTTDDIVDSKDGRTSLREAVAFANEKEGNDVITFATGGQGLIRLTQGPIEITEKLEIDGNRKVTITGDSNDDDITIAGDVTDVDASRANGDLLSDNTVIFEAKKNIIVTGLTLTGAAGGAISQGDEVGVRNSTISGNLGGAIQAYGEVEIVNSVISGNRSEGNGGAVYTTFEIIVTGSTITGNRAEGADARGGALFSENYGITVTNSIILGNSSGSGKGAEIATYDSTDTSSSGGGLDFTFKGKNIVGTSADSFRSDDFIKIQNADPEKIFANTVGSVFTTAGKLTSITEGQLTIGANGVPIIALKADTDNPALDAVNNTFSTDTSGAARNVDQAAIDNGGTADIGAVELQTQVRAKPTQQADELTGTAQADKINGLRGADTITGLGGADTLNGNGGNDSIAGNGGKDVISGNGGKDVITGNGGADLISGGGGKDDLNGGGGKDMVSGNGGQDTIKGGGGKDTLEGGGGKDFLDGGRGRDFLDGSNGADTLVGGKGNDVLTGGGGLDTFRFTTGDGKDTITDFDQFRDTIEILDGAESFDDLMITQAGDNVRIKFANVTITVENDQVENFTAADFMFS